MERCCVRVCVCRRLLVPSVRVLPSRTAWVTVYNRQWTSASTRGLATRAELEARKKAASVPFEQQACALMDKIVSGLSDMVTSNGGAMTMSRHGPREGGGVTITAGDKTFALGIDAGSKMVTYTSPKAAHAGGPLFYTLDARTGQWVSTQDGHYLLELLSRDLIYHAKGYPTF